MSHIPNSAMPHAGPTQTSERQDNQRSGLSLQAGRVADYARGNPKTAIAAGAAVIAGLAAAAAIPLVRGRSAEKANAGKSKKTRQAA